MQTLKKLLYFLTPHERKRISLLLLMTLIMALLDMIGVASIMPFMVVLTNPSIVESNLILNTMFEASSIFGVKNNQQFLHVLGIFVVALLIISLVFKALTTYAQIRFIRMREYSIGKRLIEGYLHQPYSWFLSRNSSDLGKSILSEVGTIIVGGFSPMLSLITQSMVAITLLILLMSIDLKISLIVFFVLGGIYLTIYKLTHSFLNRIGKERLKANQLRFTDVSEAFGATKEVKMGGLEQHYVQRFSKSSKIFVKHQATSLVLSQIPRYILEAVIFGGMLLITIYLMSQKGSFEKALPIISLYAFAGYRLIPAFQKIYASISQLRFVGPALDDVHDDLKSLKKFNSQQDQGVLSFKKEITLKHIYYHYPDSLRNALKDVNINIPIRTTVGLIGVTGSGKTTTVDIILGLLEPQKGTLEVDGQVITKNNCRSWQRSIGYVPQHIYLADDTVAANIAFGIDPKDINQEAVEKAAKMANLHEFVINNLPKKYQTRVGERGVRLSGGQRQRIGIARALYKKPKLLIMDEATNALDDQTEKAVMEAVHNLNKEITIILIAHRLSATRVCDKIFLLKDGELIKQGSYKDIVLDKNSLLQN